MMRRLVAACAAVWSLLPAADSLAYTVSWLGVPVVDVTIRHLEDPGPPHVEYRARTRSWFDRFYSVDNRYSIWLDPATGAPARYEKEVLERGRRDDLWALFDKDSRTITYANGLHRPWPPGAHTLFSALLWLQKHPWSLDEELPLQVEVEGVFWRVSTRCTALIPTGQPADTLAVLEARFEERVSGEPVLSTTDVLTAMLPGKGHRLRIGVDPARQEVVWVEFGPRPLQVRAKLVSSPELH